MEAERATPREWRALGKMREVHRAYLVFVAAHGPLTTLSDSVEMVDLQLALDAL